MLLSKEFNEIASGSADIDRTIRIWDLDKGVILKTLKGHWHGINCLAVIPSKNELVSSASSMNSWTKIWDLNNSSCKQTLRGPWYIRCMCLIPNTNVAVTSSGEKDIKIWDLKRDKCLCEFEGHTSSVNCFVFLKNFDEFSNKKLKV